LVYLRENATTHKSFKQKCKVVAEMAKQYTCDACGETLMADRASALVEKVQKHGEEEHNMDLEAEDIREGIEDT
jgi:predicted small metal-binding protein